MAKRRGALGHNSLKNKPRSHKTSKRMAIKHAMLAARKTKKSK
ncbi:MAG: hypothetical protein AAB608_00270 [Patescibacteria group bacterium]|mgnify:CR=1